MEIKHIIEEIIHAYGGYVQAAALSSETKKFLRKIDAKKSAALFNVVLQPDAFDPSFKALEKLTLAVGQFQAINAKNIYGDDTIPQRVKTALGRETFDQCKKIAAAAGRAWKVLKAEIIGSSPDILQAKEQAWHACFGKELISSLDFEQAIKDLNVLILGETGTGKELFAKAIQEAAFWHGVHGKAPAASVNVSAFSDMLIDSELFGHKKGSFTGAMEDRDGLIKTAHQGTFFLDEVGDLPPGTQVKLLRVIETKKIRPVGSDKEADADVRYISATNKEMNTDTFRSDLYERLAGTIIHLPPLRERTENDIEQIARSIFNRYVDQKERGFMFDEVEKHLKDRSAQGYHWPGNVRELQSFIRGVILGIHISERQTGHKKRTASDEAVPEELMNGQWSEAEMKAWYFNRVYRLNKHNLTKTANALGLNPSTLIRRRGIEHDKTS